MGVLSGIGSIIQGATGLGSTIAGAIQSNQNLDFQKQQFEYQKELNSQYMDRMDNRLQYLVKDAKKAGINPLAAIGQSGGYSNQTSAPAPQQDSSYLNHLSSLGSSVNQAILNAKTEADTRVAQNQANLISSQILNTTEDTAVKEATKKNLMHNLKIANDLNAPVGVLPDIKRDLYHEVKSMVLDRMRKDYDFRHKVNNYDTGIDGYIDTVIDNIAGDSWLNKARHWLGDKVKTFNEAMHNADAYWYKNNKKK